MLPLVIAMQKEKRFVIQGIITFIFFLVLYFLIDKLSGGYGAMVETFGIYLVMINVLLNVIMSFTSAVMMNLSTALVKTTGKEGKGTFLSSIAVLFGMLTYGCTPCVIAFFATIGIAFSVAVLPLAGLPYKFISLAILSIGYIWLIHEIKKSSCKIKIDKNKETTL